MCLFHNCEIRTEICIKYTVKSDSPKSGCHLAFHIGSNRITEFFTKTGSYSRCCLNTDKFFRICYRIQHFVNIIFFSQSTCRTDCDTLSAGYTACLSQTHVKSRTDVGLKTSLICSDDTDSLNFFTDCHTTTA